MRFTKISHSLCSALYPLHLACKKGNATIAQFLLDKKHPYKRLLNMDKKSPLELAVLAGKAGVVEKILNVDKTCEVLYKMFS